MVVALGSQGLETQLRILFTNSPLWYVFDRDFKPFAMLVIWKHILYSHTTLHFQQFILMSEDIDLWHFDLVCVFTSHL